jgi:2-succinyl-5-enolpyruvyl-6-hydroxy-3-cyclohexene-1-carboxylate synthase
MKPLARQEHNVAVAWARAAIDALVEAGLRDVVVSPGSRSTPLVAAVVEDERLDDHSVIDERSAAFVALGLAQSSERPVAVICTSGTAAANYHPAICEADRGRVPLVVITADRPPALRESGSSQSMRQVGMYGDHVRWSHDVAMPSDDPDDLRYVRSMAQRAYGVAFREAGPVHLNFPFAKPLEPTGDQPASGPALAAYGRRGEVFKASVRVPDPVAVTDVVRRLERAERPLVIVGSSRFGHRWGDALVDVAQRIGAPILAEATSQLRFGELHEAVVAADVMLSHPRLAGTIRPDVVLRFGLPPIDWPVIRWFDDLDARRIVVSNAWDSDPAHDADAYFVCDELAFLEAIRRRLPSSRPPSGFAQRVERIGKEAVRWVQAEMRTVELCDASVAHDLSRAMPSGAALVVSSSMPLRELEAFTTPRSRPMRVFCNRGLNGIDGVVSTAFGVAAHHGGSTALLIGDVALTHDIGALQLAARLDVDLTIVVVDNGGGAIFDHLPVAGMQPMYDRHFVTRPTLDLGGVDALFGVPTTIVEDRDGFRTALDEALGTTGTRMIVARTSREKSKAIRDHLLQDFAPDETDGDD